MCGSKTLIWTETMPGTPLIMASPAPYSLAAHAHHAVDERATSDEVHHQDRQHGQDDRGHHTGDVDTELALILVQVQRQHAVGIGLRQDKREHEVIPCAHRGVEQLVARWAHNPKVVCSSQASATKKKIADSAVFFHFILVQT